MAKPVHALADILETARSRAIQELASADAVASALSIEALQRVASLHIALVAVRDELAAHEPKVGGGSERSLD